MKYPNWSQVFENDPNNDAYDKNMGQVGDLTVDSLSAAECIDNIKKEKNLMFLSAEPITKDIQLLHHVFAVGENIAMPIPIIVAVLSLGADAPAVRLDSNIFATTDDFSLLTWTHMTNITDAASVSTTIANARNAMMQFRHIMAIPPFLVKVILKAASKDPAQLIVDCFAAMTSFNTLHTGDATYPNATGR